jgi:hypothetical protein
MIKVKLHECRNDIAKYNNALQTADVDTLRNECLLLCLALKNLQVMNDNENKFDEGGTIIVRAESDPASHIYDNGNVNLWIVNENYERNNN